MLRYTRVVLVCAALVHAPASVSAQVAQRFSVQASGLFASLSGDAYEGLEGGIGFEAQFRWNPSAFSIGAGLQYTRHGVDDETFGDENVVLFGGFLEPRYVFDVGSNTAAPYVSGRLSYIRASLDADAGSVETNGFQLNAGGGVLVRLTPRMNLDIGATFGLVDFGEVTTKVDGEEFTSGGSDGGNFVLRIGLAFGLGR
jgi:hypothetical protein